jgi:glutathione S-transferase
VTTILWHIEVSHYNEKARWALDFKAIPHVRRTPLPGLHGLRALVLTRGGQRRLPVLELDGRRIGDSTAIIAALEEYQSDPPLYPSDSVERARALELEDYFDEQLAPALRRYVWYHTLGDTDAVIASVGRNMGPLRRGALRVLAPVIKPAVRKDYGVSDAGAERALADIRAAMDRVEREIQSSGYLVGERFSVADLSAAALFTPVLSPPERPYSPPRLAPALMELREELNARRGGKWVTEMYARHRGRSAEVSAGHPESVAA